jgi:hypothetical protein
VVTPSANAICEIVSSVGLAASRSMLAMRGCFIFAASASCCCVIPFVSRKLQTFSARLRNGLPMA